MGRSRVADGAALSPAANYLLAPRQLGGVEGLLGREGPIHARMGKGLGSRAASGGPGLVPRPKFGTARPIRPERSPGRRAQTGVAGTGAAGGDAAVAQLLDYLTSHRITDRSLPGRDSPGLSGSSETGAKPTAEKGRAPGSCCWSGRASTKTVTRRRSPLPPLAHRVSRAENARQRVGSLSRAARRRDSCGASQRRSSRA